MVVNLFGKVWSASCTSYVLRRTAEEHRCEFDLFLIIEHFQRNFYVDDCLTSVSTEEEAIHQCNDLCHVLLLGGFRFKKLISNRTNVLRCVSQE